MDASAGDPFVELLGAKDPAPLLHRLRAGDPVHFVPSLACWVVTRHDDVKRLLNDPENATRDRSAWEHFTPAPAGSMRAWVEQSSFSRQEDHQRIRRLFTGALTPRAVRRMDAQIREVVERFAKPLRHRPGEVLDLMAEFTNPIPNSVISRVTGVPPGADEVRFRELAQGLLRGLFPFAPPEAAEATESALREMAAWVRGMASERRRSLGEDLISDLLRAQTRDETLEDDEIVLLISLLIGAGSETTNTGGLVLIQTLLDHPEQLERVRADRSLVPNAVMEILRLAFGGPGAGITRYALRDFELRGRRIRAGQLLLLSFAGANRDPAVFEHPDRLDLERDSRESLLFGHGPHYCLGASLARQELGAMLEAAFDIVRPGSCVREDLLRFEQLGLFRRPLNLPIRIGA